MPRTRMVGVRGRVGPGRGRGAAPAARALRCPLGSRSGRATSLAGVASDPLRRYTRGLHKASCPGTPDKSEPKLLIRKVDRSMPNVRVRDNEPFEAALRRFKRTIEKTGLLTELRAREFYEKPTSERKRKKAAAVKRHYKRIRSQQLPPKMY